MKLFLVIYICIISLSKIMSEDGQKNNLVKIKRNVLIILIDDMRQLAGKNIFLPNIQKLAGKSITFQNAFAQVSFDKDFPFYTSIFDILWRYS